MTKVAGLFREASDANAAIGDLEGLGFTGHIRVMTGRPPGARLGAGVGGIIGGLGGLVGGLCAVILFGIDGAWPLLLAGPFVGGLIGALIGMHKDDADVDQKNAEIEGLAVSVTADDAEVGCAAHVLESHKAKGVHSWSAQAGDKVVEVPGEKVHPVPPASIATHPKDGTSIYVNPDRSTSSRVYDP